LHTAIKELPVKKLSTTKQDNSTSGEEFLLHTTSVDVMEGIANQGLLEMSYWARPGAISDYYAETVTDEGKQPIALRLPLSILATFQPEPDHPGLEEPLTYTLGMSEDEVWRQWSHTGETWQECLDLIESIRVRAAIPAEILIEHNPQLNDFISMEVARPKLKIDREINSISDIVAENCDMSWHTAINAPTRHTQSHASTHVIAHQADDLKNSPIASRSGRRSQAP
jgi:hypothetical protein